MADVFSKRKRSEIMANVRGRENATTELRFIQILRGARLAGWRRNYRLMGKPDFVFPARKAAVFLDGCFWHGCPVHGQRPATNRRFWVGKIKRNTQRDQFVTRALRAQGWRVIRIWEHELQDSPRILRRVKRVLV
jgi:DNA mismatch endonuclease (patch repair protein)